MRSLICHYRVAFQWVLASFSLLDLELFLGVIAVKGLGKRTAASLSAFPSGLATRSANGLWKRGKVRNKARGRDGRLRHTKWKANNMHINILRRCTTLLGKNKTKELSDTTVQSILHLSKRLSSSIEMHHSERERGGGKGNSTKVTPKQQTTLSPSCSQLSHLKAIWLSAKDRWKGQTIGRSLSLSRTVTLWRWRSKGVKMGQQAIVGPIQGNVNRTLLKSHTESSPKEASLSKGQCGKGKINTPYWFSHKK